MQNAEDWRRGLAVLGIAVVAGLLLMVAVGRVGDLRPLTGEWSGEWLTEEGAVPVTLTFPGLFTAHGLPPDSHLRLRRQVHLPQGAPRQAIWLERPLRVRDVTWDGASLLGGDGTMGAREEASLLVWLPLAEGSHELGLELGGQQGRGGITGRMLIGTVQDVERMARARDHERAGLGLILAVLSILHLVVAVRQPNRALFLLFGLFCASFSAWSFLQADVATATVTTETAYRLRRVFIALYPSLGMAFILHFLYGGVPRWIRPLLWMPMLGAPLGLLVPYSALFTLEVVQDVIVLLVLLGVVAATVHASASGRRGSRTMLLTVVPPLLLAALSDILSSYGLPGFHGVLFPAAGLFVLGVTVALALRHAEDAERHERLVSGSPDAILTVAKGGRVRSLNPSARRWLGPDAEGAPLSEQVVLEDRELLRVHLAGGVPRAELRLARSPDRVWESVATAMEGGEVLLLLRDVTRRRQLDSAMLQSARLETVGGMVGGIAHDFNNMLGTLLAQVGLLQVLSKDEEGRERLSRMEGTIERASLLVRRMLTLARGSSPELEPVDLGHVCATARQLVEPTLPPGVKLMVDVPEDMPWVLGAAGDLEQVLVNLLLNARDALKSSGTIAIRVRQLGVEAGGSLVVLVVEDDGPGVDDARKADIFLPFVSTKPPGRGSGLGLAVAAQIVRDHLGRLWVEDRPGGGARFLAALRVAPEERVDPQPPAVLRDVLLVEDEEELLTSYAAALREAGFTVTTRATGDAGADCLRRSRPDILVTDVVMPGCSGVDLADTCNRLYPEVPVLLVSGYVPDTRGGPLPERWYRLDKPLRPARLAAEVLRIARRSARQRALSQTPDADISVVMRRIEGEDLELDDSRPHEARVEVEADNS